MANNNIPSTEMSLKKRINELEQALEFEKMRTRSSEIRIDIAEKELNIPIKKVWTKSVEKMRVDYPKANMKLLCGFYAKSRQGCYQHQSDNFQESALSEMIPEKLKDMRKELQSLLVLSFMILYLSTLINKK